MYHKTDSVGEAHLHLGLLAYWLVNTNSVGEAHLHLGLLAYWLVNTIRYKLKGMGIHYEWRKIVRIMNTQKVVTTSVENDKQQIIKIRKCSELKEKVADIYQALGYRTVPFVRKKSVVLKPPNFKNALPDSQHFMSG